MAQFSAKERLIAGMLSAFPGVKQFIKKTYINLNALVYRKDYIKNIFYGNRKITTLWNGSEESFFGYYDKSPENSNGDVIVHLTEYNTKNVPSATEEIKIAVIRNDGSQKVIGKTTSYNWQQGARAMWLSDDLVAYNTFEQNKYAALVYSVSAGKIIKTLPEPIQDAKSTEYYLSINYRRIMEVRPDYGYRNMPRLTKDIMNSYEGAGILKVDYTTGETTEYICMADIVAVNPKPIFDKCFHVVNHLMISPKDTGLIFVHRYYEGKRRHDRLMYFDGKNLSCILDDDMVSHYCWIDEDNIFGYVRVNGKNGFYTINVKTKKVIPCKVLNALATGDGHPTFNNNRIIVDTYPDKSRMQHLIMLDMKTQKVIQLLEVYQSVKYMNQTRCDMHPRFSLDGKSVYFDSVYNGKRELCRFEL